MKKLILMLLAAVFINGLIAQTTAINQSFETWPAPEWTIYEYGGGHWVSSSIYGSDLGYGGGNCAKIQISNDAVDNWLVSPQINVMTDDYQLAFYELNEDLQYYGYEGVYISTGSGNPSDNDFVSLSESLQVEGTWVEHTVDLSSYQGDNIYIAFVYQGTWTHWNVDEVVVSPSTLIDGALTEIVNPTGINPVPSTEDVIVKLHNFGTGIINDAEIEWKINDIVQTTFQANGININPGSETNLTIGQFDFSISGDYHISATLVLNGDINPTNDTIEDTYFVTNPKDAALIGVSPESYSANAGSQDVLVTVKNEGLFAIENMRIEWSVNGVGQTDFETSSTVLDPEQSMELNIGQFNFAEGLSEIAATIVVSGDEDLTNNSYTSYLAVNVLWESFEGQIFPPEMWTASNYPLKDYFFPPPHGQFYYNSQTDDNYFGMINDTLYTPLLEIESGDMMNFWVNNSAFYTNSDHLIWKDGTTGEVHLIEDIDSQLEQWDEVSIDISVAVGINYIGFVNNNPGSFGTSSLDEISSDANIFHFDNDLGVKDFQFEKLAKQNMEHSFNVTVKNYGQNTVEGSSYLVKIFTESGIELAQQSGITLQAWEESEVTVNYIFTDIEVQKVHAVINYSSDQQVSNNTSFIRRVYSVPSDIQTVDVGDEQNENLMIPFNTGGDTWTYGTTDISQNLYYNDELNMQGYLYGVTLYYHELMAVGQYLPLQVWIKETELDNLNDGWVAQDELQMVFNDTVDVFPGFNSVYIPFEQPILITGTNNLVIQYVQQEPEWPFTACRFYSTNVNSGPTRAIRLNDLYELDLNEIPDYWGEHTDYANTSFAYQAISENGVISGVVYDENNQPIQSATVEVLETGISVLTNSNGEYVLPSLPHSTYEIMASYMGYEDNTETFILDEPNETLDFTLEPLPLVSLNGQVFGSDAPDIPLEGVLVTLDGYEFMTAYTDVNGEFIIEDISGSHDYSLTLSLHGYHDHYTLISIEDQDLDFGEIVLNEDLISAYNVQATTDADQALIIWSDPISSTTDKLQNDNNDNWYSLTNEPNENVFLGNKFENNRLITLTSVELLFDIYELSHDFLTVEIVDINGNVIVSSQQFICYNDSLMTIDIPNISIDNNFYAMVHWQDNAENTDALTVDFTEGIQNTAYIMYPGEDPILLSDFIGSPAASFILRVNTLEEDPQGSNREVISYNIYRGLVDDIHGASEWSALNSNDVYNTMYIDETWDNNDPQMYTYAVEAIYEEGMGELSFSNFVAGYTGIGESENANIQMFPNPASSNINLSGVKGTTVEIFNVVGELLMSNDIDSQMVSFDISHLKSGQYIVKINSDQGQEVKKLIVTK